MRLSGGDSVQVGKCTLILTHKRPCGTIDRGRNRSCHKKKGGGKLKSHSRRAVKRKRFINPCHILPVGITPFSYATNLIKVTSTSRLSQDKGERFCCSPVPTSQHIAEIWVHPPCKHQAVLFPLAHLTRRLLGDLVLMAVHHSPH